MQFAHTEVVQHFCEHHLSDKSMQSVCGVGLTSDIDVVA